MVVKLALEREGIRCFVADTRVARTRLHGAVYGSPAPPWRCPSCDEIVEAQFQACWKCGTAKS